MPGTEISGDSVPRRCAEVRTRRYRGRLFIANTAQAFELNEQAEFAFRLVDGAATVREIGAQLAEHYRYAVADAVSDTAELMTLFAERQVVEFAEDHAVAESSVQS
ncbi:PqqD family protein [Amycolatopsis silviterrae]|uniref:PqqD family protein n=1 Tax=Amycolatopsis silviterrae TaxID=1656914 RepID=A0ABW5HM69_9PSEU